MLHATLDLVNGKDSLIYCDDVEDVCYRAKIFDISELQILPFISVAAGIVPVYRWDAGVWSNSLIPDENVKVVTGVLDANLTSPNTLLLGLAACERIFIANLDLTNVTSVLTTPEQVIKCANLVKYCTAEDGKTGIRTVGAGTYDTKIVPKDIIDSINLLVYP